MLIIIIYQRGKMTRRAVQLTAAGGAAAVTLAMHGAMALANEGIFAENIVQMMHIECV